MCVVCGLFVGILMVFSRYVQSVIFFQSLGILRKEVHSSCIPSVFLEHMEGLGSQGCQPWWRWWQGQVGIQVIDSPVVEVDIWGYWNMQSVLHAYSMCLSVSCCDLFLFSKLGHQSTESHRSRHLVICSEYNVYAERYAYSRIQRLGSFQTAPSNMQWTLL